MTAEDDLAEFDRAKHLGFACVGLLEAPLAVAVWDLLPLVHVQPGTPQYDVLARLILVCFAAFVAWLAFDRFDTGSGVTVLPRRWADVGVLVLVAAVVRESLVVAMLSRTSAVTLEEWAAVWTVPFTGPEGELLVGWVVASALASATSEELVHRALLLRALEGYMNRWLALVVHALVFELVHVFVYGYGFSGGIWFVAALIYGYSFQRTRSVAVPVLLHAGSLVVFYSTVWWLAR